MPLSGAPASTGRMSVAARIVDLDAAYRGIVGAMRERGRVLVAFSGGVDSGLVARIARDALDTGALAAISDAESLPRRELEDALSNAREIGIAVRVVPVSELANASYVANPTNRCYFCRTELGVALKPVASEFGARAIADGVNVSDLGDHRPGIRAMDEAGFWHPLVEFGLGKAEVRALARRLGLTFHGKPSNSCLSSRIVYGEGITLEKLRRVEAAEVALHALGFPVVRVRSHEAVARIEVPLEDLPRLLSRDVAERVVDEVRRAGFLHVSVDLRGYRSGSMNEGL